MKILPPLSSAAPVPPAPAPAAPPCIGVFDSGVGGLSVLRELRRHLPQVPLRYLADGAHAPYGERPPSFLAERSLVISEHLQTQGARLIVVACNTATAHAVDVLRRRWPGLPVVGVEPGIKPAVAASHNGRIGVLATPATVASERYRSLIERHGKGAHIISQGCAGLADLIELGDLQTPELRVLIERCCAPLRAAGVDTVLMGCTHYPLVRPLLQAALGEDVQLLDIETAVAQQAMRLWSALNLPTTTASLTLSSTGDAAALSRFANMICEWPSGQAESIQV